MTITRMQITFQHIDENMMSKPKIKNDMFAEGSANVIPLGNDLRNSPQTHFRSGTDLRNLPQTHFYSGTDLRNLPQTHFCSGTYLRRLPQTRFHSETDLRRLPQA